MKIVWASNAMLQPTGYGRIAREILPRIQDESDHEVVQYAVSGLTHSMPFPLNGVTVYGNSSQAGTLGVRDYPIVNQMENPDIWLLNFDARVIRQALQQMDLRYALYPPVDHDPIAADWMPVLENAMEMVPYCRFGERVLRAVLDDADDVRDPVYHGVDVETYKPTDDANKEQAFDVNEDTFTVGIFKNNQDAQGKPVRQIRAFKLFVEENDLEDEAVLYLHSSVKENNTYNLQAIINRLGIEDMVSRANQRRFHFGVPDQQLNVLYNACDVVMNVTAGEGFSLPVFEAFATETPVIASGFTSMPELVDSEEGEIEYEKVQTPVVEADRGWLIPVWDKEPTMEKHSWRRTFKADHIKEALEIAYEHPELREEKGEAARNWVSSYTWSDVASQWISYFDSLEDRLFETDESGIEWGKIQTESGGVGALGGDRSDD